jgi:hypothetical protein
MRLLQLPQYRYTGRSCRQQAALCGERDVSHIEELFQASWSDDSNRSDVVKQ